MASQFLVHKCCRDGNEDSHMFLIHFADEIKPQELDVKSNHYCQVDSGAFLIFLAYAIN